MDEDADLDPIRDDPAFAEIMNAAHADRRYAAAWSSDASFEAISIHGLEAAAHLRKSRELIAQGYRPVSWSVSKTTTEVPMVTASVWHRPTIQEKFKDRPAERQARAAVALVRMGKGEEVWPLLRLSADPRLRSFIVNWLNPLGADPKQIATELDRLDSPATPDTRRVAPPANPKMDAVLFHPETSQRRALILALGTYGKEGLSPGDRELLTVKLLDLYCNDPDSGIHGAAEWTLGQLKQWGPDPDGPMIGFTWYVAANYCNWLSAQEGLPKDQWCYLPNEAGAYAEGMTIPADVLERSGYRLPTEAEWEFACRSGTVTSYYFGLSIELLGKYARYQANSEEHAWSCGSLLPNDLGLFDMLGNEFEWAQDSIRRTTPRKGGGLFSDIKTMYELVNDKNPRPLRGGSFYDLLVLVRSALRNGAAPSYRDTNNGFRPAKTCH